jgi:hypothetical protein
LAHIHRATRQGVRNRKLFLYAQAVKGTFKELDPMVLKRAFDAWWAHSHKAVGTKDKDTSYADFRKAFESCRHPGGFGWLDVAKDSKHDKLPDKLRKAYPKQTRRLLRAMAAAPRGVGAKEFILSCEHARRVLGVKDKMTASRILDLLVKDGVLRLVKKGLKRVKGEPGKASTWLYMPMWVDGEFNPEA